MSDYNNNDSSSSFASSGVGTAGLTLGVIGTALASGILGNGGFGGLFGSNSASQQIASLQMENAILKADSNTDKKLVEVYTELRSQDKAQDATISALNSRILALETSAPLREQIVLGQVNAVAQSLASSNAALQSSIASINNTLAGLTKTVIPNTSVCPGWGNVTITPATAATTA